ncbi:hypothetical protein J3A83DRAFT_4371804 [Scleroderma citrinum]
MSLLASVSLFALVVSSRPVLTGLQNAQTSPEGTVQTAFRIDAGKDIHGSDAARVPFLTADGEHVENPFQPVAPIAALIGHKSSHNTAQPLLELDNDGHATTHSQVHDLDVVTTAERLREHGQASIGSPSVPESDLSHPTISLPVLVFSCIAALLALACVVLVLYVMKYLVFRMLGSEAAWNLLPQFRKSVTTIPQPDALASESGKASIGGIFSQADVTSEKHLLEHGCAVEKCGLPLRERPTLADAATDIDSDWDDTEKYEDALDMTPMPTTYDLPPEEAFMDPPLPEIQDPSVASPRLQDSHHHSSQLMSEVASTCPSRPLWSIRASASPPLGLTSSQVACDATPQPIILPHRRAYRSVPEFDIALALQLRPGLGLGADSAWMVRFLMTIFGWFAVTLSGNR